MLFQNQFLLIMSKVVTFCNKLAKHLGGAEDMSYLFGNIVDDGASGAFLGETYSEFIMHSTAAAELMRDHRSGIMRDAIRLAWKFGFFVAYEDDNGMDRAIRNIKKSLS